MALITETLMRAPLGPYQLEAPITAVHDGAARAEVTDWRQILALHELLERIAPSPTVTSNRAVAVAIVSGPRAGLDLLSTLEADQKTGSPHRLHAVRAHLLEMSGETAAARAGYLAVARLTTSLPERRHLKSRAARLAPPSRA